MDIGRINESDQPVKLSGYPKQQPRRIRQNPLLRGLTRESGLSAGKLVAPLFVTEKSQRKPQPVASMPGVVRHSVSSVAAEAKELSKLGVGAVLLFGIPKIKDAQGSGAYDEHGIVPQAIRAIKKAAPNLAVIADVCLCEYTDHGHCGVLSQPGISGVIMRKPFKVRLWRPSPHGSVDNAATLPLLAAAAVAHARAGADMVAPSAMMDGQVASIRKALDQDGFSSLPILSYSVKYASAFYGPFRDAAASAPRLGDRRGYQIDPANLEEALRETALDIEEGADCVMVKPAMAYLDVVRAVKKEFNWPTAVYQVSGEYAMVKAAVARGWLDEKRTVLELATAMRRAGGDFFITYYAKELAHWLSNKRGA